jgi:hypothetical protein
MSTAPHDCHQSAYPGKKAVILGLIEREILDFRFASLSLYHKPRYKINVLNESAILLLMGFKDSDRQGELYGYYRGLMEQILAIEINSHKREHTKLQAEEVYEALMERKEFLRGIYRQEQSMMRKFNS